MFKKKQNQATSEKEASSEQKQAVGEAAWGLFLKGRKEKQTSPGGGE